MIGALATVVIIVLTVVIVGVDMPADEEIGVVDDAVIVLKFAVKVSTEDVLTAVLIGALAGFSLAVIIAVVTDVDVGVLADMRYDMVTGLEFAVAIPSEGSMR